MLHHDKSLLPEVQRFQSGKRGRCFLGEIDGTLMKNREETDRCSVDATLYFILFKFSLKIYAYFLRSLSLRLLVSVYAWRHTQIFIRFTAVDLRSLELNETSEQES